MCLTTAVQIQCSLPECIQMHICRCLRVTVHTLHSPPTHTRWRYSGSHGNQCCFRSQRQTSQPWRISGSAYYVDRETEGPLCACLASVALHKLHRWPQASFRPGKTTQGNSHQAGSQSLQQSLRKYPTEVSLPVYDLSANRCK